MRLLLLAALVAVGSPAANAAEPSPTTIATQDDPSAKQKAALELVGLVYRKEAFPAFRPGFDAQALAGMRQQPRMAEIDKRYPGALTQIIKKMGPATRQMLIANLPSLHAALADHYVSQLSLADLNAYLAFMRTPAGTAVVDGIARNIDVGQVAAASVEGNGSISLDGKVRISEDAAVRAIGELSDKDLGPFADFLATPAGQRAAEADRLAVSVTADWQARLKQENGALFQRIVLETLSAARKK